MKLRILICFFLVTNIVLAQDAVENDLFGIEVLGLYNLEKITGESDLLAVDDNYTIGLNALFNYEIRRKLDLIYGAGFRNVLYSEKDYTITFGEDRDRDGGFDQFKSWTKSEAQIFFASGSAFLKYKTSEKDNHFYFKGGLDAWYHVGTNVNTFINESGLNIIEDVDDFLKEVNQFQIAVSGSIGSEFKLKNIKLFVEGRGSFMPLKLFKESSLLSGNNEPVNLRLLPIGIVVGCFF